MVISFYPRSNRGFLFNLLRHFNKDYDSYYLGSPMQYDNQAKFYCFNSLLFQFSSLLPKNSCFYIDYCKMAKTLLRL